MVNYGRVLCDVELRRLTSSSSSAMLALGGVVNRGMHAMDRVGVKERESELVVVRCRKRLVALTPGGGSEMDLTEYVEARGGHPSWHR